MKKHHHTANNSVKHQALKLCIDPRVVFESVRNGCEISYRRNFGLNLDGWRGQGKDWSINVLPSDHFCRTLLVLNIRFVSEIASDFSFSFIFCNLISSFVR